MPDKAMMARVRDTARAVPGVVGGTTAVRAVLAEFVADKLPRYKSPVALELMRAIKRALDPQNLLNPGRVIRG